MFETLFETTFTLKQGKDYTLVDLYSQSTDAGFASEPTGIAKARGTPLARSAEADSGMRVHLCVRIE